VVGNIGGLSSGLGVENEGKNYLYFDSQDFFNNPFTHTWNDEGGRQYFFNFLFKTSLFGEFNFDSELHKNLAYYISFILLFFVILILVKTLFSTPKDLLQKGFWVVSLNIIFPVLFLLSYRVYKPFSANGDFRFIYPCIFFFIIAYITTVQKLDQKYIFLKFLSIFLVFIFCLFSLIFFIYQPSIGSL
jgi:hypothetical protein